VSMTLPQLQTIIQQAGGGAFALDYANDLLVKVNNVANHQVPVGYLSQLSQSRNAGDLRGRLLEINLVNYFFTQNVPLSYEVKQGTTSGDIDLLWKTCGADVFIEVKLLGQDQTTKQKINQQLDEYGVSASQVDDDTSDVMRLQYTIIDKATLKKFQHPPFQNAINLIAIDVSELQLGNVDAADCVLATLGSARAKNYFGHACARDHVFGLFEKDQKSNHDEWVAQINAKLADKPHPRNYIHGVIFLFREPKELAALSYDLKACIAWNTNLISDALASAINVEFHKIIPCGW
jgi:hypothetical protein